MIQPKKMETPETQPDIPGAAKDSVGETNWERFYREFRKPGYIFGYEIQQRLGGGVFGIVFKAKKESIGKAYAIKFLRVEDPSVRTQVLNELETVTLFAQVDHPNLVTIEDKGLVDGIPYIIMGYAGDETLKSRIQEGPLSQAQTLSLMKQVLQGVKALHDHGLAHFDLKPANLFIHGDIVRVGDYGLSKLIRESCSSLSFGRGTPYYMAPEMLRRKGDQRSDIYSLGVIFFECLTGTVPFEGENEWEVLKAHEEREVSFPPQVPQHLKAVLRRMLVKDPELRVQDLGEVLASIEEPKGDQGKQAPAESQNIPTSKPVPPPLPFLKRPRSFSCSRRVKNRPKESSSKRSYAALALAIVVSLGLVFSKTLILRNFIGLLAVLSFSLLLFFWIRNQDQQRNQRAGMGSLPNRFRRPRPSSGGKRFIILLGILLGFFLFVSFLGFLFLGVSQAPRVQSDSSEAYSAKAAKVPIRFAPPSTVRGTHGPGRTPRVEVHVEGESMEKIR
jgi:serine/threonine protein kinase